METHQILIVLLVFIRAVKSTTENGDAMLSKECKQLGRKGSWDEFCMTCVEENELNTCSKDLSCETSLPQSTSEACKQVRNYELTRKKAFFKVKQFDASASEGLSLPVLDQTINKTIAYYATDKFSAHWFNLYFVTMGKTIKEKIHPKAMMLFGSKDFTKYEEYFAVSAFVRKAIKMIPLPNFKFPSAQYPYFTDLKKNGLFLDDRYFVEQRLAGMNPMTIQKVTLDDSVGRNWDSLEREILNSNFNWQESIKKITGKNLKESISSDMVYISEYPLLHEIPNVPNILQTSSEKGEQLPPKSPIAILAVQPSESGENELKPVAIQTDYKQDSKVFTPSDGHKWEMAKALIQMSDLIVGQLYQHLVRTHLRMEPLCIQLNRHLSKFHPMHEILRFHCRGLIPVNKNGIHALLGTNQGMHKLFAGGNTGAMKLVQKGFSTMTWNDIGYRRNIMKRGMDSENMIPFYPYRDDGALIDNVLKKFSRRFVNLFYKSDEDVASDSELQKFIAELSTNLKGLPTSFNSKKKLQKFMKATLWIAVQHSFVNFPVTEYGENSAFSPTKLFQDPRANEQSKFAFMLPGWHGAVEQAALAYSLGSLHYDSLFDYSEEVTDRKLQNLVKRTYASLMYAVKPEIDRRNEQRFKQQRLTNPFMVPGWMPNSIST